MDAPLIKLYLVKRTHPKLLRCMAIHYSQPKGFVGRNICYAVVCQGKFYGAIVGGSATKYLPGRNNFFGDLPLNNIVNNIFFHVQPKDNRYPVRNFTQKVLKLWRETIRVGWYYKYGDTVLGFESLVELPRTGEVYKRDGWTNVGTTKGFTCKRTGGRGTDSWSGQRIWDTKNLRPKLVFVRFP